MAWINITFAFESKLTAAKLNNLQNNLLAITAGDLGAPKLQNAALSTSLGFLQIASNSVTQSDVKSTTAEQSQASIAPNATHEFTPTGGDWTMNGFVGQDTTISAAEHFEIRCHSGQQANLIRVRNRIGGATKTAFLLTRFIQASPPYNLGNGDIPLFIFLMLDKTTKEIIASEIAEDPPWYAHGPHMQGLPGRIEKYLGVWGLDIKTILGDPVKRESVLARFKSLTESQLQKLKREDFTQVEKNIDMKTVPHLFNNFDANKHVIVLADPCGDLVETLYHMKKARCFDDMKKECLVKLFDSGKIKIKDQLKGVHCPPQVLPVGVGWVRSL